MAAVIIGEKFGFINTQGDYVIPPIFDWESPPRYMQPRPIFSEGLAPVSVDGKLGYIDKTGQIVIEPEYMVAEAFYQDVAPVLSMHEESGIINRKGEFIWGPVKNLSYRVRQPRN